MSEPLNNQPIVDDEFDDLERLIIDSTRIAQILIDPEYANDFKRKLIYQQIQYIREGANNWVTKIENRFDDNAVKYILDLERGDESANNTQV